MIKENKSNEVIRTFHSVVTGNVDDDNASIFIDKQKGMAFGGHRRTWGIGDLLVRYQGDIPTEGLDHFPGVYHYSTNSFTRSSGLPAKTLPQGGREILTPEECDDKFQQVYNEINGYHQLVLNPRSILDFIENQTATTGISERVLNISPFEVANERGHFVAKTEVYEGELVVGFSTPQGYVPLFLEQSNSYINLQQLAIGEYVVVAPVGVVEGKRIVRVISRYEPGIRISVQHFKAGLLMPGNPKYSVFSGESGNDIRPSETEVFPFIEGQERLNLRSAPLISIQLDTAIRALEPLSEYKRVELLYKNSHTKALLIPAVEEGQPAIDVVFSPLAYHRTGKVITI